MAEEVFEEAQKVEVPAEANKPMSAREASQLLQSLRDKKEEPAATEEPKESEAQAEDAAPPEEAPGETQADEPAEEPLIEPPRSWSRDEKERFRSLPRETQEYIAERETNRDHEIRRAQNEAADKLKALSVKEQEAEQRKQQYESALPQVLQVLQTQMGEFSDIKSMADAERLAREDKDRYLQWDLALKKFDAVKQELTAVNARQEQEKREKFDKFSIEEDGAFAKSAPEVKDPKAYQRLQQDALATLKELGFSDAEIGQGWSGVRDFSLRDHRLQLLIRDASMYRMAQQRAKEAVKKPVPKAQRPGTAVSAGAAQASHIKDLEQRLAGSTGNAQLRIATELMQARRQLGR
jgi:hypothetical protein